jgi:hypothetical protein
MNFDGKTTMRGQTLLASTTISSGTPVQSASITPNGYRYTLLLLNEFHASAATLTATLEDSADDSNWAEIGTAVTDFPGTGTIYGRGFLVRHEAARQYVRLKVTRLTGTIVVGVTALQYNKINSSDPISQIGLSAL